MTPTPPADVNFPVLSVLEQCYRMAGVLKGSGQGLSPSEQQEGLHLLNTILDGIKTERFFFYQILRTLVSSVISQKQYTVGDAGLDADWVIERPERILSAGVLVPATPPGTLSEIPIYVCMSYEEYQKVVTKDSPSALPQLLYYQPSLPTGTAILWPVPNQIYSVVLYTPQTVQEFTDVNADFIVPKGYREFLEYAGAVAVHDRYPDRIMDVNVRQKALDYKARVLMHQWTPSFMRSDPAVMGKQQPASSWVFNGRTLIP